MFNASLGRITNYLLTTIVVCLFLGPSIALASPVTYTYTGYSFTSFVGLTCPPDCAISGSFTVPSPLGDSFNGVVNPANFKFTDGNVVISESSPLIYSNFGITTDSHGAIIFWGIELLVCPTGPTSCSVLGSLNVPTASEDYVGTSGTLPSSMADNSRHPGTWSMSSTGATPEPSSLLLLATGLLGLGAAVRRFAQS